jgi:hypothetical protein
MKTCGQCGEKHEVVRSYPSKKWISAKGGRRHVQVVKTNWRCPNGHTVQTWRTSQGFVRKPK